MPMTPKEMIKYLKKNGFEEIRQNDSHITMKNHTTGISVVGSLSLQINEKRIGAGNIETGRAEIALPPEK